MVLLTEISDSTLGIGPAAQFGTQYELRKSARAILRNSRGNIAVQHLATHHFHKLPGGGVDKNESVTDALVREIREEVGCELTIDGELGLVIEFRHQYKLLHLSYGFTATVAGPIGKPQLEAAEIAEGMSTLWIPATEALVQIEKDKPTNYQSHFILEREKAFLTAYLQQASV